MAIGRRIKRKLWNIIKVFRQVKGTLDTLEDLLNLQAQGKPITAIMMTVTVNRILAIWEAGIVIDTSE